MTDVEPAETVERRAVIWARADEQIAYQREIVTRAEAKADELGAALRTIGDLFSNDTDASAIEALEDRIKRWFTKTENECNGRIDAITNAAVTLAGARA